MEYVGGTSLKTILKDRMRANGGRYDPLPVDQAIAYIVEMLPAFQYLHDLGLLYCDFKPDNMIQVGDDVKLIDLGGVRLHRRHGLGDLRHDRLPGARGAAQIGPIVAVGHLHDRAHPGRADHGVPGLPDAPTSPRLPAGRGDPALPGARLALPAAAKACAPDPADRFASADELRVQLLGVLREIVARAQPDVALHSAASVLFGSPAVTAERLDWHHLPTLRVDPGDAMASWLTHGHRTPPAAERLRALRRRPGTHGRGAAGPGPGGPRDEPARHRRRRSSPTSCTEDPWEWRAIWMQGLSALVSGDVRAARAAFNAVYGQVPGELAPKLALAMACENSGEPDVAEALYATCARTDANYTAPAAFGLARIRAARGDVDGAVTALDLIPPTSRAFVPARQRRATMLAEAGRGLAGLAEALASIETVTIEPLSRARLRADVLASALHEVTTNGERPDLQIGGVLAREVSLRDGLELAYRHLAGLTPDPRGRIRLVDQANAVRRWSLR